MGLASSLIRKRVEDAKYRWPELESKPGSCRRFCVNDGKSVTEKLRNVGFLSGLCLEANEERYIDHGGLLSWWESQ
jgi:hypothetical protein